jgi:hypothetical protein
MDERVVTRQLKLPRCPGTSYLVFLSEEAFVLEPRKPDKLSVDEQLQLRKNTQKSRHKTGAIFPIPYFFSSS